MTANYLNCMLSVHIILGEQIPVGDTFNVLKMLEEMACTAVRDDRARSRF